MESNRPDSLSEALDFMFPSDSKECSVKLSQHIGYGDTICGGYSLALVNKAALLYASQHPKLKRQADVRSISASFLRPIFPTRGELNVVVSETTVGQLFSQLRVEAYQGKDRSKLALCADTLLLSFRIPGATLNSGWQIQPAPTPVDLTQLEEHKDPNWVCYHMQFHTKAPRRCQSYLKNYVPTAWTPEKNYYEQWIQPGWDCTSNGSRDPSIPEARWTNETIPFVADMFLPIIEKYLPRKPEQAPPIASMTAVVNFGTQQSEARNQGRKDWRKLQADASDADGNKWILAQNMKMGVTLNMTLEVKKKLPKEGVRWLYMRTEIKNVVAGRFDMQVLLFDEKMELIAVRNGVEHLLDTDTKVERKAKPKM